MGERHTREGGHDDHDDHEALEDEYDVVIVGGGPTGCSAGVFTARYGFDTLIFDRGRSSLRRCAYLENYPGFPEGIGVETFYGLLHDHAEAAGCALVADLVESVHRIGDGETDESDDHGGRAEGDEDGEASGRFVIRTQEGRRVTTERVLTATRYGGEYLRSLGETAMFVASEHDEEAERFDRSYADAEGRTPIEGLYVGSPSEHADHQAIIAAGHGARVARALVADHRRDGGYWEAIAAHYDWVRADVERSGEWEDRERWREYFEESLVPEDHDRSGVEFAWLRERYIDERFEQYVTPGTIERRTEQGARALLERLDDEYIRAYLDDAEPTTPR